MSFWSGEKLGEQVKNCIIGEYNISNIDCAAFTLHVGPEIFVTPDHYEKNPSQNNKKQLDNKEAFTIPSGQFAFLLTEEQVQISNECIAFISMKATTKFKGLVNVSGFHVDPGYKGRLVFSVFNAGPIPIKLQRGMPLFLMWIADLDRPTSKVKNRESVTELDLKIIDPMHGPIFSPQAISESVKSFESDIKEDFHKIETKVSILMAIVMLLGPLIIAVAGYQIKHLMDAVDELTAKNIALNNQKSILDLKNIDANKLTVIPDKSRATSKAK